jgi:integrase
LSPLPLLQHQPMTLPLFPETDDMQPKECLRSIFKAWVDYRAQSTSKARAERPLREESATVYQEMWHAFADYCETRSLDITEISSREIEDFLTIRGSGVLQRGVRPNIKEAELTPRYSWRMLTLIDRVTRFHVERAGLAPNQAAQDLLQRPEYRYANASDSDPLPEHYSEDESNRLIDYLTQVLPTHIPGAPLSWKEVRDRTAVAMMLGGGLTPGDVRALKTGGISIEGGDEAGVPWKLSLPGNGNSPARETPLAEWAGRLLAFWLSVRTEQEIPGVLAFPATRVGKPWSHTACHDACKSVLASAELGSDKGGMFKLRHTFALRQLAKGTDENDVARWLGLVDINSMSRYRRIVTSHVDIA